MTYEHAEGFKIRDQGATHFLTFTTVGWIDIFSRQSYRDIILDSLSFCRKEKGLSLGAYVIMTNHLHLIWRAKKNNLSNLIRDFKSFTSKRIISEITKGKESRRDWLLHMFEYYKNRSSGNDYFKVWTSDNHPEQIFSHEFMHSKLRYIHENPVRAGFVREPCQYLYSSAMNYATGSGLIEIDFLY